MKKSETILNLKNISLTAGGVSILRNINFTMQRGENWAIVGPNGAGKSSLFRILSGDILPSSSESSYISVLSHEFGKSDLRVLRSKIGLVCNRSAESFSDIITTEYVVLSGLKGEFGYCGHTSNIDLFKAKKIMASLGVLDCREKLFKNLSDGERRRTLLARALITEPELLVLDEPYQGLDFPSQKNFFEAIEKIYDIPFLIITHDVSWLPRSLTHILMLKNGEIITAGKISEVMNNDNLSKLFGVSVQLEKRGDRFFLY